MMPMGNYSPTTLVSFSPNNQQYHTLNTMNSVMNVSNALPPINTITNPGPSTVVQYTLMQEIKNVPKGNEFQIAMSMWQWVVIDNIKLPCVFRQGEKFLSSQMVQMRLLAKFPATTPSEVTRRYTMVSHKMLVLEAWIFNTVNAVECKFEFGYQLFTPNDEVVRLNDVERFYMALKAQNLLQTLESYNREIKIAANLHTQLAEHIGLMKERAEDEFKVLMNEEMKNV